MTKRSDTQTIILSRAAQNEDRIAMPLPDSMRGGAAAKMVGALIAKGFLEEVDADPRKGELLWRDTGDGHGVTLVATRRRVRRHRHQAEGYDEPASATCAPTEDTMPDTASEAKAHTPRKGAKQEMLIEMLRAS